jgi:hypothetical protein
MANEQQPKDYVSPQERLADKDWASVASEGVKGLTPAASGWVLAIVIMFLGMTFMNYLGTDRQAKHLGNYLTLLEQNRAQELRRTQEALMEMTRTVAREAERLGRMRQQIEVIDQAKQ